LVKKKKKNLAERVAAGESSVVSVSVSVVLLFVFFRHTHEYKFKPTGSKEDYRRERNVCARDLNAPSESLDRMFCFREPKTL